MTRFSRFSASDESTSESRASDSGEDYGDPTYSRGESSQTRKDEAVQVYKGLLLVDKVYMLQEQIQVPRTPRPSDIDVSICFAERCTNRRREAKYG